MTLLYDCTLEVKKWLIINCNCHGKEKTEHTERTTRDVGYARLEFYFTTVVLYN